MKKLMSLAAVALVAALALAAAPAFAQNDAGPTDGQSRVIPALKGYGYAVVNADGTLARGYQALAVAIQGTGQYTVRFTGRVRQCVYQATPGLTTASGTLGPAYATVVGEYLDTRGVWVQTFDAAGNLASMPFHLTVNCKP